MARIPVTVAQLRPGDRTTGSGILITSVSAGVRTPSGKLDVFGVRRNGKPFSGTWRRGTTMMVERKIATDASDSTDALAC